MRELLAAALTEHGIELDKKQQRELERSVLKAMTSVLMREGFTMRMAADGLGVPRSTLTAWQTRDKVWAAELTEAKGISRSWLLGMARQHIEYADSKGGLGGKAAGRALGILANLYFPELRETKQQVEVSNVPAPGASEAKILALVNRD